DGTGPGTRGENASSGTLARLPEFRTILPVYRSLRSAIVSGKGPTRRYAERICQWQHDVCLTWGTRSDFRGVELPSARRPRRYASLQNPWNPLHDFDPPGKSRAFQTDDLYRA